MPAAKVAVVIPFHNDAGTIAACLRSVVAHTVHADWRLLVVDDGSDGCGLECLSEFPKAELVRRPRGGVAAALNTGFALAGGCDVVRLHADAVIETPGWLERLQAAAYHQPGIGAVGARIVYPDGRIQSEGRSIVTGFGFHPLHRNRRANQLETAAGKLTEVDSVAGALAYYRRDALDAVGGLDEGYGPAWFEDDDFCFGIRRRDFRVFVEPAVRAVHYTRGRAPTFQAVIPNTENFLNDAIFRQKHRVETMQAERWRQKWGWDPLHPDLSEIRRLYGATQVCWQVGEKLRFRPTEEFPSVDCCLVTYNTLPLLRRMLGSLAQTEYPQGKVRVYVANNGSTDGTREYLEELRATYPFPLEPINLAVNTGVAPGMNFAFGSGKGELVARLDDDIVLPPGWLRSLVADLHRRPFAGCVGARTVNDDDRRAIQWACPQTQPTFYLGSDEPDIGQADYFSRALWAHGCCNLYRRDAIARCGPVDLRYSPSQWDDVDHNIALINAGYEVLYDGRVVVVHKKGDGLNLSSAGLSSGSGNGSKLAGKWGRDVFDILDAALLRSREGRSLPPDGDTSAVMARGPSPGEFPRKATQRAAFAEATHRIYDELTGSVAPGSELARLADVHLEHARTHEATNLRASMEVLLIALNFAPLRVDIHRELAAVYAGIGVAASARTAALRGLHLSPADPRLLELSGVTAEDLRQREERARAAHRAARPGAPRGEGLRVLLVNGFIPRQRDPEETLRIEELRRSLEARGVQADLARCPCPDASGYDLVHVWASGDPFEALSQTKGLRVRSPSMPIVVTADYCDLTEADWARSAFAARMGAVLRDQGPIEAALTEVMADMAGARARAGETRRLAHRSGPALARANLLGLANHILVSGPSELAEIQGDLGALPPHTVVGIGVDAAVTGCSKEPFLREHPCGPFALFTGPVTPSGNLIGALHALKQAGLRAVVVGQHADMAYLHLCRAVAPAGSLFLPSLDREMLASAFAAAAAFVKPAWARASSLGAAYAAMAATPMVLGQQSYDRDWIGDRALYCDVSDPRSLAQAIDAASRSQAPGLAARLDWREAHASACDAASACDRTIQAYSQAAATVSVRSRAPVEAEEAALA